MYESFFGLNRRPFSITPDSRCFAKIGSAKGAFDSLSRCLEYGEGVGIVTGATGSGKSLLCLALAAELENRFETAFLAGENFSSYSQFLKTILTELDEPLESDEKFDLQNRLKKYAAKSQRHRSGIVLLIDEAQSLEKEICAGLRVISNWNVQGKPLVRILLSGNWDFEEMLLSPEFEFLNERVGAHVILESFSKQETSAYIDFRIRHCGGRTFEVFTNEALGAIGQISEGVPRVVNLLCDRSLLIAFENDEKPVSLETVCATVEKLKHLPVHLNEFSIRKPVEETDSARPIDSAPIATELDWNDSDESESFTFEVGASDTSDSIQESDERFDAPSSGDDSEEVAVFEVGDREDSHSQREWETRNDTLVDSSEEESPASIESNVREEAPMENDSMEFADISGDSLETEENPVVVLPETKVETPVIDEAANTNGDLETATSWKKVPVDLRWNDSTTTTFSSSELETLPSVEREKEIRAETLVEVTSSQKYARIRPEQLLQTHVSEALTENQEKIESNSSWLRHNDTKIFDCIASEPISYRDDTYNRMKDDYEHSLELVEEVSSVASTSCESDVVDSLLTLLKDIEEKFSGKTDISPVPNFASSEKNSETYAVSESPARFDESPDEMYDIVLPETAIEKRVTSFHSRQESDTAKEFELPRLQGIGEYRYLVSDLYRKESP